VISVPERGEEAASAATFEQFPRELWAALLYEIAEENFDVCGSKGAQAPWKWATDHR
jgi:hypothetical protein